MTVPWHCLLIPCPKHQARVLVPDERFTWLCNLTQPKSKEPAFLEVVDIAGLVKGAADGAGLGNAFLSNISVRVTQKAWIVTIASSLIKRGATCVSQQLRG